VSAKLPHLLLRGQSGRSLAGVDFRPRQGGCVKDSLEVSHQQLHHQRLVGVVHQGGQGHLCIYLPRLHQCGAEDDAQVTCVHFVLLCLFSDSVVEKSDNEFTSKIPSFQVVFNDFSVWIFRDMISQFTKQLSVERVRYLQSRAFFNLVIV